MLNLADQHPETKEFMVKHLDEFLEHPRDRGALPRTTRPPEYRL